LQVCKDLGGLSVAFSLRRLLMITPEWNAIRFVVRVLPVVLSAMAVLARPAVLDDFGEPGGGR